MIRHGAKLVHAFAEATVPSVTVILRKAFGGAFIAMNSQGARAPTTCSRWPDGELGVMGAEQAVGILNRREIARRRGSRRAPGAGSPRATPPSTCTSSAASADGFVDEVIAPERARARGSPRASTRWRGVRCPAARAGNIPL